MSSDCSSQQIRVGDWDSPARADGAGPCWGVQDRIIGSGNQDRNFDRTSQGPESLGPGQQVPRDRPQDRAVTVTAGNEGVGTTRRPGPSLGEPGGAYGPVRLCPIQSLYLDDQTIILQIYEETSFLNIMMDELPNIFQ